MKNGFIQYIKVSVLPSGAAAFLLNLPWEYLQCRLFFVHEGVPPTTSAMLYATLGDALLTVIGCVFVTAVRRDWDWLAKPWNAMTWIAIEGCAVTEAIGTEVIGLTLKRWSYTPIAPLIPGLAVSVIPVLQLALLFPATFALTALLSRPKGQMRKSELR